MGDQDHAPVGDAEVRTSGCWSLWKNIAAQDGSFGHPESSALILLRPIGNLQLLQLLMKRSFPISRRSVRETQEPER